MAKVRPMALIGIVLAVLMGGLWGWLGYQDRVAARTFRQAASGDCSAFTPFGSEAFQSVGQDGVAWLEKHRDLILAAAPTFSPGGAYVRVTGAGSEGDFAEVATIWQTPAGWRGQGVIAHMDYSRSVSGAVSIDRPVRIVSASVSSSAASRIEQILATPCLYDEPAEVYSYSFKGYRSRHPAFIADGPDRTLVEIVTPEHRRRALQFKPVGLTGTLTLTVLACAAEGAGGSPGFEARC